MKKAVLIFALWVGLPTNKSLANIMKSNGGYVKFLAKATPGFLKVKGESVNKFPEGQIKIEKNKATGEFTFDLVDLKDSDGIQTRNDHMKNKYLEIQKFPSAKLSLHPIDLNPNDLKAKFTKSFIGDLTLHGKTNPINGQFDFNPAENKAIAKFQVSIPQYNIDIPKHMGVVVGEVVEMEIAVNLIDDTKKEKSSVEEKVKTK